MASFRSRYLSQLLGASFRREPDNWADYRFGPFSGTISIPDFQRWVELVLDRADDFAWLESQLADDASRKVLMDVLLYRSLGHLRVRHRHSTPAHAAFCADLDTGNSRFSVLEKDVGAGGNHAAHLVRLEPEGIVAQVAPNFLVDVVHNHQYTLDRPGIRVAVEPGDVVFDCGTCWGETALLFAHRAGPSGRVHAFEVMPENLVVMRKNIQRNPSLAPRIAVVEGAIAARSGEVVRFAYQGLASHRSRGGEVEVTTLSLDDYATTQGLDRVDVLKFDIEGGESGALDGAVRTIQDRKPKIMISAYHRMDDLLVLPRRLRALRPHARMFLDHHTIHGEETVLYVEGGV
jgi:FkbM family methyltransferase